MSRIVKFALTLVGLSLLAIGCLAQQGQWWLQKNGTEAQLSFRYSYTSGSDHSASTWSNSDAPANLGVAGILDQEGQVKFDIARPAGRFQCQGWMSQGSGSGQFTFAPDEQFSAELNKRGVAKPDAWQSMKLAIANVTLGYVDSLRQIGYNVTLDELVRSASHGVTADYLREMQAAGLQPDSLSELVRMRDHGVTAKYVRELKDAGYSGLTKEQIVRMRDHGVSAEYVQQLAAVGFKDLEANELIRLLDHGVSAQYASSVKQRAYPDVTPEQLIRLQDHGVSLDYIQKYAHGNSVEELIHMRDTGGHRRDMI